MHNWLSCVEVTLSSTWGSRGSKLNARDNQPYVVGVGFNESLLAMWSSSYVDANWNARATQSTLKWVLG